MTGDGGAAAAARMRPLDGIRTVAVLAVLCYHGEALPAGYLGVDCFFVLSGFLITGLLLQEHGRTGRISLRDFWLRRAFRLLPALFAYLAVGLLVAAVLSRGRLAGYLVEAGVVGLGVANWWQLTGPDALGAWTGHLWSLSVEQQFYLLWPLLLVGVVALVGRRRRVPLWASVALVLLLVAGWRLLLLALGAPGIRVYLGLDTRAEGLLTGALVAALAAAGLLARVPARWWRPAALLAWGVLAGLALLGPEVGYRATWMQWVGTSAASVAAAVVIGACVHDPRAWTTRALGTRPMVRLGEISYAFYLWHYPIVVAVTGRLVPRVGRPVAILVAVVLTLGMAELSRLLVEGPVARRRRAWTAALTRRDRAPAAVAA